MKNLKLLLLFVITLSSCADFVKVDLPREQLLSSNIFTNDETASAALLGIYIDMVDKSTSYRIPLFAGYASDELDCYSVLSSLVDLYTNSPRPEDSYSNELWTYGFSFIYQANAVIEGCTASTKLNSALKQQLIAEAHFIRAFWMYYLINFFGDIPLVLSTDYEINAVASRTPAREVYIQIEQDLIYASNHLSINYVDGTGTGSTDERIRPNQYAAMALLARVYLTVGNWQEAVSLSEKVIEKTVLYDTVSIDMVFLKDNKEAIWQLSQPTPRASDISTPEGYSFALLTRPSTGSFNRCSTVSQWLLNSFEIDDLRKQKWLGEYIDSSLEPNESFHYPNKYKVQVTESDVTERSTVLRLGEQYLIRSEANAQLGNIEGALVDVNLIRKRAGLQPIYYSDKELLLNAILKERQVELFSEWGHRWIDLKRMGYADEIMPGVLAAKQGGEWDNSKTLWPIPQTEIDRNRNLVQNHGYN